MTTRSPEWGVWPRDQPQNLRAADSPVVRDVDFFNRYDAGTRAAMVDRVARNPRRSLAQPNQTQAPTVAENPSPARPVRPLANFFNRMRQLVWPADAPSEGEFAAKGSSSDAKKRLELLHEVETARLRPGRHGDRRPDQADRLWPIRHCEFMRDNSTPSVADAFHSFLLSLYDSIGQSPDLPRH